MRVKSTSSEDARIKRALEAGDGHSGKTSRL